MTSPALLRYCQEAQRCNLSANFALRLYRVAGGTIKRASFLEAWAAAAAAEAALSFPGARRSEGAA